MHASYLCYHSGKIFKYPAPILRVSKDLQDVQEMLALLVLLDLLDRQ